MLQGFSQGFVKCNNQFFHWWDHPSSHLGQWSFMGTSTVRNLSTMLALGANLNPITLNSLRFAKHNDR